MGLVPFGGIKVSRAQPTISVRIPANTESLDTAELYIRRVGAYRDELVYTPSVIADEYVEFTLDELFFELDPGRYQATFKVLSIDRTVFQLQYDFESVPVIYNKATP
jgi:hypothetical protein